MSFVMKLWLLTLSTFFLFDQIIKCNSQYPSETYTYCSGYFEFLCDNGVCIPSGFQCDGDDDCGDWSDEAQCEEYPLYMDYCSGDFEFLCDNRICIPSGFQCDGENDCGDLSDEAQCDEECYTDEQLGKDYRGYVSRTSSNKTCQKWTSQTPHEHSRTPSNSTFTGSGLGDHNYCRNPDDETDGPWCYTTDPDSRFEFCDIGELSVFCNSVDVPADCGGVLQETTGTIMTPNYPSNYPNSARCTWILQGPEQSIIILNVSSFRLQDADSSVCYDWLELLETKHLTGTDGTIWCGSDKDTFESSANYLWLQFVSQSTNTESGFSIEYRIVTPTTESSNLSVTSMRTTHIPVTPDGEKEINVSTKEIMVPTTTEDRLTSSLTKFPSTKKDTDTLISISSTGTIILGTSVGVFFLLLVVVSVGCLAYFRLGKKRSDSKPSKTQSNQLAFGGPYDTTVGAGQSSFFRDGASNHVNEAYDTDNIGSDDTGIYHDISDSNTDHAYATTSHPARQDTSGHDTFALAEEDANVDTEQTNQEGWVENDIYTSSYKTSGI